MERNDYIEKVVAICRDVFDDDSLNLTEESNPADVEAWDSLTHLSVISDIEDEFGVSFTLDEITNVKNLGAIVDALIGHLKK